MERLPNKGKGRLPFQWWISQRYLLDQGEISGFVQGEEGLFISLIPPVLGIGCLHDNKEVIGVENAVAFNRMVEHGAKGTVLADHKSFVDSFLIQLALAVKCSLWDTATKRFLPVIGMMYASRYPIESLLMRSVNFVAAVQPTMEVPKSAQRQARKIWEALKEQYPSALTLGYVGLIFAEGTRSRCGAMEKASSGIVEVLRHQGSVYLPTAIEGPEKIMPPADGRGIPLPIFTQATRVIFGNPITFDWVNEKVAELQQHFNISYRQAFIDVIYREIALLHINHGDANYTGYYSRPLEDIYTERIVKAS